MTYPYPTRQQEIKQQKIFAHNYMVILGVRTYVPPLLAINKRKFLFIFKDDFFSAQLLLCFLLSLSPANITSASGPFSIIILDPSVISCCSSPLVSNRHARLVHADPDVAQKQLVTSILISQILYHRSVTNFHPPLLLTKRPHFPF